jgi:hypothetical protein
LPEVKPVLYQSVPSDWTTFYDIYDEAVASAPPHSLLIECGSFWGKSAIYLAEAAKLADKNLRVYSIDTWGCRPENNPGMFSDESFAAGHIEPRVHREHHNSMFETFAYFVEQSGLSPDPLRILRMDSLEAAWLFKNSRLFHMGKEPMCPIHFIFLDDDHEYDHVLKELKAWYPSLAPGGIIAGHDWTEEFSGVEKAVTAYFSGQIPGSVAKRTVEVRGTSWLVRGGLEQ